MLKKSDLNYFFGPAHQQIHVQEWGTKDDQKKPVIFLVHGFPGCADHGKLMSTSPLWDSFRLIAVDRPGYGRSAYQKNLTPLGFADQIKNLFKEKNIEQLSIISVSGGAPYALALAYLLQDQVTKLTSIGGVAPLTVKNFKYMNKVQKRTWFVRQVVPAPILKVALKQVWQKGFHNIEKILFNQIEHFSQPDQQVFSDPEIYPVLVETTQNALQQGPEGLLHDMKIYSKPWGFPLDQIRCPVTLWHGGHDDVVHVQFAQDMKQSLPKAQLNYRPHEGHYSILHNCRDAILSDLL